MTDVYVITRKEEELCRFLEMNGFGVEDLGNCVYRISREDELPVFLRVILSSGIKSAIDKSAE